MSFKHTKHWDSELAYEKGMVKSDPLQKQASLTKEADITPTSDLMQNIIKLCAGLRAEGLEKEAAEVETNFLNYKQAQTLYETSKEKGEDLVDAAHPKGSHKLEGVDSEEAVVEDIVDRHNKMKAVVDKKPTGKYASSKDILNAVKVTLGADPLAKERGNLSTKKGLYKKADITDDPVISAITGALATYGGVALIKALKKIIADYALKSLVGTAGMEAMEQALLGKLSAQATNALGVRIATQLATGSVSAASAPAATAAINTAIAAGPTGAAVAAAAAKGTTEVAAQIGSKALSEVGTEAAAKVIGWKALGKFIPLLGEIWMGWDLGSWAGAALFEYYLAPDQLNTAGTKLIEKGEYFRTGSIYNDPLGAEGEKYLDNFKATFAKVMENYSAIAEIKEQPTPESIAKLKNLDDALLDANKWAGELWSFADSKMAAKTFSFRFSPLQNYQDLVNLGNNYVVLSNKIHAEISKFVDDFVQKAMQKLKEQGGGTNIITDYQNVLNFIKNKIEIISHKVDVKGKDQLLPWLQNMNKYVAEEQKDFGTISIQNRSMLAKEYADRLQAVVADLQKLDKVVK